MADMEISVVAPGESPLWDAYVSKHPRGIPYLLSAFATAVEKAYGFNCFYLMAKRVNRICGVLPLAHIHLPASGGKLVSLPYCDAAGPLADTPEIEKILITYALSLAKKQRITSVEIRSTYGFAGLDSGLTRNNEKVRMLLELPGGREPLMASLKAKVRNQVKKPIREGLTAEMGGPELLNSFYRIFSENMRDLGSPVHSSRWIRQVLAAYGNRAHIGIVRMPDGQPAAGGIILCHPGMVSIPWASSLRRLNRWNPNMLLYWTLLAFAADSGYPRFDFGRSTPGEGTYRFKRQWGAVPHPLHWAVFDSSTPCMVPISCEHNAGISKLRSTVATVLSRTPVSAVTCLGSHFRKYISL